MARDYKPRSRAQPRTRRAPPRRKGVQGISRWSAFGIGLCVGAIATALIFVNGAKLDVAELTAGLTGAADKNGQPEETTFEFYTVLPDKEIVVPDPPPPPAPPAGRDDAKVTAAAGAAESPGDQRRFMLQAASFRKAGDADELKARLALLGLEATVQRVSLKDSGVWFRVKLGPYVGSAATEAAKERLAEQNIRVLTTRLR
jgi:cell division protein FtsN